MSEESVGTLSTSKKVRYVLVILLAAYIANSCCSGPAQGANFATHGGLAENTLDNDIFVAGALLADLDKFLPPGVPQTDSHSFATGLIDRAKGGSNDLKYFATGWYEHLDQDSEFYNSFLAIQAVHPEYTQNDVRLVFDYLTIQSHQTDVNVTFIMDHTEILDAIRGGLTIITNEQIRLAIWDYMFSESLQAPGLLLQMKAAELYASVYPERVNDMVAEYNSYFDRVTADYYDPFWGMFTVDLDWAMAELDVQVAPFLNTELSDQGDTSIGEPKGGFGFTPRTSSPGLGVLPFSTLI
ncbi:MAG: hypothetical protein JSV43_01215 [Methanobacteriota archaeon]|nr:MAG: hypothetical protein JSV43_01215 [Euryarchaeota archaeon]